jgi:ATP-binding cassette subfamily B protein
VSGKAAPIIEDMPLQYQTQLGKWFKDGASSPAASGRRSRCRAPSCATTPTSSCWTSPRPPMDAAAEAEVFEHFRSLMGNRIAIVISHRFSTVRMADQIVVLDQGRHRRARQSRVAHEGRPHLLQTIHAAGTRL